MSAADSQAAVDRVVRERRDLGEADFAIYALVALSILAQNAPDVLHFILDRTDTVLSAAGGAS